MKFAKLLHNPEAGHGEYGKKELISMIQSAGYGCSYSSTKEKGWEKIESKDTDFIILAGGDGTVRRVSGELLNQKLLDRKLPIALLPMGTANNIAKTLGLAGIEYEELIGKWNEKSIKKFDVGRIYGIKKTKFFLESFGFGIFPDLMEAMRKFDKEPGDPEKNLQTALEKLHTIIMKAAAHYCKINIDGVEHKGNYLLVEVMNTTSMGPKLQLAPLADPGDGFFDVILISEKQREQFATYVENKLAGKEEAPFFNLLRAKRLDIFWDGTAAHVDDEMIELKKPGEIEIDLRQGLLEFFISHSNGTS
jgi:diacylglycerol kinase (ATP)